MRRKKSSDNEIIYLDEQPSATTSAVRTRSRKEKSVNPNGSLLIKILLIIAILYVLFLILGVLTTEFYTDENGKKVPVTADLTTLEDREDYDNLTYYISQARDIMRDVTIIDIKLLNGVINYGQAAVQYQAILNEQIETIIPKLKTVQVQTRNEHIKQNIQVIFTNDIALYLQLISKGLTEKNMASINDASAWKESMMQTYQAIDRDILELAKALHRENSEFFDWKLEKAVTDKDPSAVIKADNSDVPTESSDNS